MTGLGVISSGAVFGALLMLFPIMAFAFSGTGFSENSGMLIFTPVAAAIGGAIAGIAAIPVLLLAWLLTTRMSSLSDGWKPRAVRRFAASCGFLSGFGSFLFLSGFNLYGAAFSLCPGIVGWLVTEIFVYTTLLRHASTRS